MFHNMCVWFGFLRPRERIHSNCVSNYFFTFTLNWILKLLLLWRFKADWLTQYTELSHYIEKVQYWYRAHTHTHNTSPKNQTNTHTCEYLLLTCTGIRTCTEPSVYMLCRRRRSWPNPIRKFVSFLLFLPHVVDYPDTWMCDFDNSPNWRRCFRCFSFVFIRCDFFFKIWQFDVREFLFYFFFFFFRGNTREWVNN